MAKEGAAQRAEIASLRRMLVALMKKQDRQSSSRDGGGSVSSNGSKKKITLSIPLPLTNMADFQRLEIELRTKQEIRDEIVSRLHQSSYVISSTNNLLIEFIQIAAIVRQGGDTLETLVKAAWKMLITDELASEFLWVGQEKKTSKKTGKMLGSQLCCTVFGESKFLHFFL